MQARAFTTSPRTVPLALLLLEACGALDPASAPPLADSKRANAPIEERLLPLRVGATWTYEVATEPGRRVTTKSSAVEALEEIRDPKAGITAYRIRTEKEGGTTLSWQEDLGDKIVRHREETFDAEGGRQAEETYVRHKLRVDESPARTLPGASWEEHYTETRTDADTGEAKTQIKTERWEVEALESISVPAGTFECLRISRAGADAGQARKTFWFAGGVGKVKELGAQSEELVTYAIPSAGNEEER